MDLPLDFAPVVRAHLTLARGYLVAESGSCLEVQREEIRRIRRRLEGGDLRALFTYRLYYFTVVAVLICTEREHRSFLEWAYDRTWDELRRVFVYAPKDMIDTFRQEQALHGISFSLTRFGRFQDFHKDFGGKFNHMVYLDAQELKQNE